MMNRTIVTCSLAALCLTATGCQKPASDGAQPQPGAPASGGDEGQLREKASFLCLYGHLERAESATFPAERNPADYVAADDLTYLKHEKDSFFSQLFRGVKSPRKVGGGIADAIARRSTCTVDSVKLDAQLERASVKTTRTHPVWSMGSPQDIRKLLRALDGLPDRKHVAAQVGARIDSAKPRTRTKTNTTQFIKQGDRWVVLYGLKERYAKQREESSQEKKRAALKKLIKNTARGLGVIRKNIKDTERALPVLRRFTTANPRFAIRRKPGTEGRECRGRRLYPTTCYQTMISMTVENRTGAPVSRVFFDVTFRAPGEDEPLGRRSFLYRPPRPLRAGARAKWRFPGESVRGPWPGVKLPPNTRFDITVGRLEGARGEVIAALPPSPIYRNHYATLSELRDRERALVREQERYVELLAKLPKKP